MPTGPAKKEGGESNEHIIFVPRRLFWPCEQSSSIQKRSLSRDNPGPLSQASPRHWREAAGAVDGIGKMVTKERVSLNSRVASNRIRFP